MHFTQIRHILSRYILVRRGQKHDSIISYHLVESLSRRHEWTSARRGQREKLSAVTNLVIMSGSERDKALSTYLRKIVNISDEQEEAIRLAIKRRYESAMIDPYNKRRGRPPNQKK